MSWATSSKRDARCAITVPAGFSVEPRVVRSAQVTPAGASIDARRLDTACWVDPNSRAAFPRLSATGTYKNALCLRGAGNSVQVRKVAMLPG
jgi:hypothetical protein